MSIPQRDTALAPYATNFAAKLVASPTVYKTTAQVATQVSQLVSAYTTAQAALVSAREGGVRSEVLRVARDTARTAMLPTLQSFYGTIQKDNTIADTAKTEIGVHIVKKTRSKQGVPTDRPTMSIVSVFDRTITTVIRENATTNKRRRPAGAVQAQVYWFAGENYPSDPVQWHFAGNTTKSEFEFAVPESVAGGTRVWVCCAWTNREAQAGPVSVPTSVPIQGTGSASAEPVALKIAA